MNKNRIRRSTTKIKPNTHPQFFINRSEIPFEVEKRVYVESVCQVLIESRFGACFAEPVVIDLSDQPEPVVFSDLFDADGSLPGHALSFLAAQGRADTSGSNASVNERTQRSETHSSNSTLTPNQGRGSP